MKNITHQLLLFFLFLYPIAELSALEKATIVFAGEMTEIATEAKGGYPELATLLKQQRASKTPTFFLFSGGSLGPSTLSSLDRGTHIIDLLNSLEPDAMGVAKREFSFLEDELSLRSYEAAFPLVASNIEDRFTHENLDGLIESVIVQQGPYKLGILSLLDKSVIEEYAVSRVRLINQRIALTKLSQKLRKQDVDFIVLLYSTYHPNINQFLDENLVDISLMRDEHTPSQLELERNYHARDLLMFNPSKAAIISIEWEKGNRQTLKADWQLVNLSDFPKNPEVLRQVRSYSERLASLLQQKIGLLTTQMDTRLTALRTSENAFANFITDTLREYTGAEIAFINGGTIRGGKLYQANSILLRSDIIKELPFRNKTILLDVTGKQIIAALENGFSLFEKVKGRFPQVSGMQVQYDTSLSVGSRVVSVKINGQMLEPGRHYKLVTTDYLSTGGDGFSMFKNLPKLKYDNQMSRLVSDIIIDSIKSKKNIAVSTNGRLVDINKNNGHQSK